MTITITYQGLILTILAVLGMILLVYLIPASAEADRHAAGSR